MSINKIFTVATLGCLYEQMVIVDLMHRGYGMFRSCSTNGKFDMVAWDGERLWRIQVKGRTARRDAFDGSYDILALVGDRADITYEPEIPAQLLQLKPSTYKQNGPGTQRALKDARIEARRALRLQRVNEVGDLFVSGLKPRQIAEKLKLSIGDVRERLTTFRAMKGMNGPHPLRTHLTVQETRELRASGLSLKEIAAQTGVCVSTVQRKLFEDTGTPRSDEPAVSGTWEVEEYRQRGIRALSSTTDKELEDMRGSGMTYLGMAEAIGTTVQMITGRLKGLHGGPVSNKRGRRRKTEHVDPDFAKGRYLTGATMEEIAKEVGASTTHVWKLMKELLTVDEIKLGKKVRKEKRLKRHTDENES